jgi:VWFA-related protein
MMKTRGEESIYAKWRKTMLRLKRGIMFLLMVISPAVSFSQQLPVPAGESKAKASEQNPPKPDSSTQKRNEGIVRINTQLVQVDAVITDKKGRHVEDLTAAEIEMSVDGKQQPLTYFKHINLPGTVSRELPAKKKTGNVTAPESMPTRQLDSKEVRRTIAFIVDDLGLSFKSTEFVRETLRKFVAEQMQEGDFVAIIRTGNGLGMLEQFTSDKRILYSAIERLIWNPLSRDMMPSFEDNSVDASDDDAVQKQATLDAFDEFRETNFSTGTLGAISFVVQSLRTLPGRKSVILLSDGFRINSQNDDANTTNQLIKAMQDLVEQANRSSVVVYSIDAKGLQPFMPGADVGGRANPGAITKALDTAQEALEGPVYLAKQTGGFMVTNTNDLNIGIQEAIYDQQSYYLIGFDPEDEKFDRKFHSIKIKANRPGLTVRTRSGFFGSNESEEPSEPKTRGEQILSALMSPLGKRDLPLRMTPYFFNSSKLGPLVRTLFYLDCSNLTFKDGPNGQKQLNLEIAAFAFDEKGATSDMTANRINLSFNESQYQQVLANGLAYRRDFTLKKPGAYQFRAVLRDSESGLTGSASQFIQVPDLSKKRLAMSGLVLTTPAATDEKNPKAGATQSDASAPQPGGLPSTPYVRRFSQTGWIQYGAAIYNATTDKKTGKPQVTVQAEIFSDGKPIYKFPAHSLELATGANPEKFDYVGKLRLNNLPAGDYLLHMIVTDGLAKKKYGRADQWMDFSVK